MTGTSLSAASHQTASSPTALRQTDARMDALTNDCIRVRGARTHNLQNIHVDLPRQRLVVLTGVSGSGKSSLALDTLFVEGQRRYLDCLSARTRQSLDHWPRPDVDLITGLPPTLSIDQRAGGPRLRSTLATTTGLMDFLRLLYARAGQAFCPDCEVEVARQTVDSIVQRILRLEERSRVMLLAPLIVARKGAHREVFEKITKAGFVRARVDGDIIDAAVPPDLARGKAHTIEAIVDRIVVKPDIAERLRESVELALKHGEGTCLVSVQQGDAWRDQLFSSRFCCPQCGTGFAPVEPRSFSFNSPYGACAACRGLGRVVDPELQSRPRRLRIEWDRQPVCPDCLGSRLAPFPRAVRYADLRLHELTALTVTLARELVERWQNDLIAQPPSEATAAATGLLPEILSRLRYLERAGAGYLTLDRPSLTLSGGEFQRARLAGSLGSGLTGVCYILDEPTVGLHPRDTGRMIEILRDLRDGGSSVLVVEHDVEVMRAADWLVDLGPGAGRLGGRVTAAGPPDQLTGDDSATVKALRSPGPSGAVDDRLPPAEMNLRIEGARLHNLKEVTADIPLNRLVAVTGVSGSGKTSLIMHTLVPALKAALSQRGPAIPGRSPAPAPSTIDWPKNGLVLSGLSGFESLHQVVVVDQSPLGRSGRANPATQTGVWDEIRRVFAKTREARLRGFTAQRFSFNVKGGRCEACEGRGFVTVALRFLPDLVRECPVCRGARFNAQTLSVRFRDRNAAEVLQLTTEEAAEVFDALPRVRKPLRTLCETGLGYLQLGQSALTLSGGEAQRIRLAAELARGTAERILFVLDEPTTGLHPEDVSRLLVLLKRLVREGHSVIVIEHHPDVILAADHLLDLGPEGGDQGGLIVACGSPVDLLRQPDISHTIRCLAKPRPGS